MEKQSEPRADEVKPKADPSPKKREGADAEVDLQAVVANAVANAVKPLKEQLERYERGNVNQSRLQALTDRLNACKDESFRAKALKDFGRMTFDTEEAFNEYLTDTETDVADANKRMADAKLAGGPAGPGEFGRGRLRTPANLAGGVFGRRRIWPGTGVGANAGFAPIPVPRNDPRRRLQIDF